jgi:Leucine-rich repeat (LRR) protein
MGKTAFKFLLIFAILAIAISGQAQNDQSIQSAKAAIENCNSIIYRDGKAAACIRGEIDNQDLIIKIYPQQGWGIPNRASLIEMQGLKLKPVLVGNIRLGYHEDISVFLKDASIWYNYEGKGSYPASDKVNELSSFVAPLMVDLMTCGHLEMIGLPWIPMGTLVQEFGFKEFDDTSTLPVNPQFSDDNKYDNCILAWPDQPMKLKDELIDRAYLDYPNYISIRIPLGTDTESGDKYIYVYVKLLLAKLTDLSYACKYASCEFKIPLIGNKPIEQSEVKFPDPNLEAAIRAAINKPEGAIYAVDLEGLTELDARNRHIKDLTGLQYCSNLKQLCLMDNQIIDVSPLSGLTKLEILGIGNNQITDVLPLSGLGKLESLSLWSNKITDVSPLSGLNNLNWLELQSNQIADVAPLFGLNNLNFLNLDYNQITDLSQLSRFTNLQSLQLEGNKITDILPLSKLTKLKRLDLSNNQITDILPLSKLTNLESLDLHNNQITDISPLSGLSKLEYLGIGNNRITDLSPISKSKDLDIEDYLAAPASLVC